MLASISPLGERARHNRWSVTVTAYVAASLLAGAALGALVGLAGGMVRGLVLHDEMRSFASGRGALLVVALVCLAGAVADARGRRLLGPSPRRQVNDRWMVEYRGWVYGAGFGAQLGVGLVTIITTAAVDVTWLLAAVVGSPAGGAVVGGAFGLARALPVLALRQAGDIHTLRRYHLAMQARASTAKVATTALLALFGVMAVLAAIGTVAA